MPKIRSRCTRSIAIASSGAYCPNNPCQITATTAGATTSYGALASGLGKPQAVRAVGAAVGRNPLSIVVPCHRVVGGNGSLTGYAGGLDRKQALLQLEGALIDKPHQ